MMKELIVIIVGVGVGVASSALAKNQSIAAEDGMAIAKQEMKNAVERCSLPASEIAMEAIASKRVDGREIGVTQKGDPIVLEQDSNHITFNVNGLMAKKLYSAVLTIKSDDCSELGSYAFVL